MSQSKICLFQQMLPIKSDILSRDVIKSDDKSDDQKKSNKYK